MASKTVTTPENKARVLELIGEGLSVREICRQDDMPSRQTVYNWIEKDKDFVDRYARACARRADVLFDALLEIADGDGDVNRDRLRVDARKWSLSKMQPKKYGDRLEIDGEVATTVVHRTFHQPKPKGIE
jgi:hypothetical protein